MTIREMHPWNVVVPGKVDAIASNARCAAWLAWERGGTVQGPEGIVMSNAECCALINSRTEKAEA